MCVDKKEERTDDYNLYQAEGFELGKSSGSFKANSKVEILKSQLASQFAIKNDKKLIFEKFAKALANSNVWRKLLFVTRIYMYVYMLNYVKYMRSGEYVLLMDEAYMCDT